MPNLPTTTAELLATLDDPVPPAKRVPVNPRQHTGTALDRQVAEAKRINARWRKERKA